MTQTRVERVDACIVGAGIAGLNALFVASQYLKKGGRVALVDRRPRVGGMWNDTYDYVCLHQPHPLFTAGNLKWQWDKDPSYLATKHEVLGHFQHCLDELRTRTQVQEYFGWDYRAHEEADGLVRTTIVRDGETVVIESAKLVKAFGFNVEPNEPLALSSDRVRSVSPDYCDMRSEEMRTSDAPVWIIGGGKTAMDTAHVLITQQPGREVNLVAGSGTYFTRREAMYPATRRWIRGIRGNLMATRMARRYDGTNDDSFHEPYQGTWETSVTPTARNWFIGLLSDHEAATVRSGLAATHMDHLADAVDAGDAVELVMRSGVRHRVPPGSWIVNCTGYLLKHDPPYEPYTSPSGNVLSINNRSTTMAFTSFGGYYLTHLLFLGKLRKAPLYELDWHALRQQTNTSAAAAIAVMLHNFTVLIDHLPKRVFLTAGIDADRWYPAPRRLLGVGRFQLSHRRDRERFRRTLDTVRERYGVRCGPVTFEAP